MWGPPLERKPYGNEEVDKETPLEATSPAVETWKGVPELPSSEDCEYKDAMESTQFAAQVLLSSYFFANKRFLEAQLHANGAATLAVGYKLHKIRSTRPDSPTGLDGSPILEIYLPPPQDAVEEGERIRGFWVVACLQSKLNLAMSCASSINSSLLEFAGSDIDTPWPMEMSDYEGGAFSPTYLGADTVGKFLVDEPARNGPTSALHAQASILLHRASRCAAKWSTNLPPDEFSSYMTSYTWLDARITNFWRTLPTVYLSDDRTLVLTHALVAAASIRINRQTAAVDPEAQEKCLLAARSILQCLGNHSVPDLTYSDPVVGPVCSMACSVLLDEIRSAQKVRADWAQTLSMDVPASEDETALLVDLQHGISTMTMYAAGSPLVEYLLGKLQREYNSLCGFI
ncbi:hypothetical protein B0H10DRAFT_2221568 [Mycena sp. CBHHK59/15]|nr:hypothetical protein B0H10DRAFT_2221568 [Mycena sp. CBHHK59/15]